MPESYYPDYSEHSDEQLDELLCEYVDGTMDPTVRVAFEEYLAVNPELARHARCLCETRVMLCSYGCRHPKEESIQDQIRKRIAGELVRQDRTEAVFVQRLGNAAMLTSTVSLVVILAMVAGFSAARGVYSSNSSTSIEEDGSMTLPADAYYKPGAAVPLEWSSDLVRWSFMGPSRILPEIDMVPLGWKAARLDSMSQVSYQLVASP